MILDAVRMLRPAAYRPWLVLGKGPTLDFLGHVAWAGETFALNDACLRDRDVPITVAHFTDLDAFDRCARHLGAGVNVVMPWRPHVNNRPGVEDLAELAGRSRPALGRVMECGRLWGYNSTLASKFPRHGGLAVVRVRYFSAVAAFNLLGAAGVNTVCSLGVDGGTGYAAGMDGRHRLANGRPSFDCQFAEIDRACSKYRVVHRPLALGGSRMTHAQLLNSLHTGSLVRIDPGRLCTVESVRAVAGSPPPGGVTPLRLRLKDIQTHEEFDATSVDVTGVVVGVRDDTPA